MIFRKASTLAMFMGLFSLTACFETKTVSLADRPSTTAEKRGTQPFQNFSNTSGVDPLTSCTVQNSEVLGSWYDASTSREGAGEIWSFDQSCIVRTPDGAQLRFSATSSQVVFAYDNGERRSCTYQLQREARLYMVLTCDDSTSFMFVR